MRPGILSKHMGHHIAEIDEHPLARGGALKAQWPLVHPRECVDDGISDCAGLSIRFS